MPLFPLSRWTGALSVIASALIVQSEIVRLAVGLMLGPNSAATVVHTLTYGLALLGMYALVLAITALYFHHQNALGRLGLLGYATAVLGTVMVAGDWWFEAFAVPMIAERAPQVLAMSPTGSVLAGAIATAGPYTVGWALFGLAAFRAGVFPRPAALLLIAGALLGPLALSTPYQIPLAVAVGWIGCSSLSQSGRISSPTTTRYRTLLAADSTEEVRST
jgi:hypothetical protein